jgi:hypothetical protein
MTDEAAILVAVVVLLITVGVYIASIETGSRANSFFAYVGSFTRERFLKLDAGAPAGPPSDDSSPRIMLITCVLVLLLGVILNKFYDKIAYGGADTIFPYKVEVRHDFERARSELKSMQQELEALRQFASQPKPRITLADETVLGRCEDIRVRQLALQADLVRIKGEIIRRGLLKDNGEPDAILPKVEAKIDRLTNDIAGISKVCASIGKVGISLEKNATQ